MFLLNLDYLTELSKLGPKSKRGNLHFLTKFWPPQQNARTFQPREWREGELKSKAELLKEGSNSLSCYRFWQKTDPKWILLLAMLCYTKPREWSPLDNVTIRYLVLLYVGIPTRSARHSILAAVAHSQNSFGIYYQGYIR